MRLRTRLAVLVCKASGAVLRKLGRGGTNLPGRLALKIDKNILGELSRGVKVTVVTGTNGKTTTSRMIEQAFADAGLSYFSNKSGANLLTGIIAVFAQHATAVRQMPLHPRAHRVRRGRIPPNEPNVCRRRSALS